MKKILCMLGGLICGLLCSICVKADVIWEPDDSFYQKHAAECTYVSREYTADGPEGKVIVYKSPELAEVVDTWKNGTRVSIIFTYEDGDGILWGVYDNYRGSVGWVPMDYMKVVYDYISFQEEYSREIKEESGTLEGKGAGDSICLWKYPGSEECETMEIFDNSPDYRGVYTDETGHKWGYVGYYYGWKNWWICIDQPAADYQELYPDGGPLIGQDAAIGAVDADQEENKNITGTTEPEEGKTDRITPKGKSGAVAAAVIMVVLVAAVSGVLLIVLRKSRKE